MKNRHFELIKNIFLFTMSTFIPKAISFLLVPLYTNCLSTVEYGIADIITTTVSFAVPILTLNISDAVLRFTIENKKDKRPFQVAAKTIAFGTLLLFEIILLNLIFNIYSIEKRYQIFFLLQYILTAIYGVNISYLRAIDKVILLSVVSIANTLITILMNLLLLVVVKMGLTGYLLANALGLLAANIIICTKINFAELIKGVSKKKAALEKKMFNYSIPLVASGIAWWFNSASDRYFVTYYHGASANGIYSVAYKIPTILQLLQSVFSQAWLLTIYNEYDKKDGLEFVGKIYDIYNGGMCISCAVLIILDIPIAKFLFAKNFFYAWKYVPILLLSVVFIANAGFFETIITLFKQSKTVAITAVLGAIINMILNAVLIYYIGLYGAAIATVFGYLIMWLLRIKPVMKFFHFPVNWIKHSLVYILLVIEIYVMIQYQNYTYCILITIIICIINVRTIINMIYKIMRKYRKYNVAD